MLYKSTFIHTRISLIFSLPILSILVACHYNTKILVFSWYYSTYLT